MKQLPSIFYEFYISAQIKVKIPRFRRSPWRCAVRPHKYMSSVIAGERPKTLATESTITDKSIQDADAKRAQFLNVTAAQIVS